MKQFITVIKKLKVELCFTEQCHYKHQLPVEQYELEWWELSEGNYLPKQFSDLSASNDITK